MLGVQRSGRGLRTAIGVLTAIAACLLLAACGSSSDDSSSSSGSGTTAGGGSSDPGVVAAKKRLERLYAGTSVPPPSDSPPPARDKNVWIISLAQNYSPATLTVEATKRAAETIGWTPTVFDGRGDPNQFLTGVRQAVAAKADGIVMVFIDCESVKAGVQEAVRADIEVVGLQTRTCENRETDTPPLYDAVVTYEGGFYPYDDGTFGNHFKAWSAAQADWLIAETDGKAKVIDFYETDAVVTRLQDEGFKDQLATCRECEVVETVPFTVADLGPPLQQKAEQALLKNPDANAVVVPADGALTSGVAAAIQAAPGRRLLVAGGEGQLANVELMRERRGQDMVSGQPLQWDGYAAIDAMNRLFNGTEPVSSGIGLQVIDREHNMPPRGEHYRPLGNGRPIDFAAAYEEAWSTAR